MPNYQEGGKCPECGGILFYPPVEDCYCHLSAPCAPCTDNLLLCRDCDFEWHPDYENSTQQVSSKVHPEFVSSKVHPEFVPAKITGRAPETEVIYGRPTYCCGQNYIYESLARAQYGFPFTVYSMDDYGNLFTSERSDLYVVNAKRKPHSPISMRVTGWYPPHLTKEDVRAEVNGTFGGHFETFGNGQFSFIAYTD